MSATVTMTVKKRIRCTFTAGVGLIFRPRINVWDYDLIPALTLIKVYFPSIKALSVGLEANTYTRVRVFYKWINYSVIYYETRVISYSPPPPPSFSLLTPSFQSYAAAIPTAANSLSASTINASVSGSNYVGGTRTHTFSFSLTGTLATSDFLMFDYPANYFDSQGIYSGVTATGFTVLVVYQTNQIYL